MAESLPQRPPPGKKRYKAFYIQKGRRLLGEDDGTMKYSCLFDVDLDTPLPKVKELAKQNGNQKGYTFLRVEPQN